MAEDSCLLCPAPKKFSERGKKWRVFCGTECYEKFLTLELVEADNRASLENDIINAFYHHFPAKSAMLKHVPSNIKNQTFQLAKIALGHSFHPYYPSIYPLSTLTNAHARLVTLCSAHMVKLINTGKQTAIIYASHYAGFISDVSVQIAKAYPK